MDEPETLYATTPDGLNIAYQVVGDGPHDIVLVAHFTAIDMMWEHPEIAQFLHRLARMGRLIVLDCRGIGVSDPVPLGALPTPEAWADDIKVVLDAVGSTSTSIISAAFGGFLGAVFAATYPERMHALIMLDSYARALWAEDYPAGLSAEQAARIMEVTGTHWGKGITTAFLVPNRSADDQLRRFFARWERSVFSPAAAKAILGWELALDVRSVLPAVQCPTLVMHHEPSRVFPTAFGRALADLIPNARLRVLPGPDWFIFNESGEDVLDEIEEFITGVRPLRAADRSFATVLLTDIVDSTPRAAEVGDHKWRQILDEHDALIEREISRHRGQKVNSTGDGVLARFDGPTRAVQCALSICSSVKTLGIELRAGVHSGEVELRRDGIGGIAVHIGQRVSALAGPGEVLVSRTVTDLVAGSGLGFEARGEHELKGVPGKWAIYAVKP